MKKKVVAIIMIILALISLTACTGDDKKVKKIDSEKKSSAKEISLSEQKDYSDKKDNVDIDGIKKDLNHFSNIVEEYKNIEKDLKKEKEKLEDKVSDKKNNTVSGNVDKVTGALKEIINK